MKRSEEKILLHMVSQLFVREFGHIEFDKLFKKFGGNNT